MKFKILTVANMEMTMLWDVALCNLVEVSEVLAASIINVVSASPLKRRQASTRLQCATSQKTLMF